MGRGLNKDSIFRFFSFKLSKDIHKTSKYSYMLFKTQNWQKWPNFADSTLIKIFTLRKANRSHFHRACETATWPGNESLTLSKHTSSLAFLSASSCFLCRSSSSSTFLLSSLFLFSSSSSTSASCCFCLILSNSSLSISSLLLFSSSSFLSASKRASSLSASSASCVSGERKLPRLSHKQTISASFTCAG